MNIFASLLYLMSKTSIMQIMLRYLYRLYFLIDTSFHRNNFHSTSLPLSTPKKIIKRDYRFLLTLLEQFGTTVQIVRKAAFSKQLIYDLFCKH